MSKKARRNRVVEDVHIEGIDPLYSPLTLKREVESTKTAQASVLAGRRAIREILAQRDPRLLVVIGPCSIHDPTQALHYALWVAEMRRRYGNLFHIVMRVYLAKPRTTIGWKGYAYDPYLDGSGRLDIGLRESRQLLLDINHELGVPCGTEFVDSFMPQFVADLVAWACIGARTTESQPHRELASGLSMPVGFKNTTDGKIQPAVDGIEAARHRHCFLGLDESGRIGMVRSLGNPDCHLVLRGGNADPNYDAASIESALELLRKAGRKPALVVDCSHGNSRKKQVLQAEVWRSVIDQRAAGMDGIVGVMVEGNQHPGSQPMTGLPHQLKRGLSVTDECVGISDAEAMFEYAAQKLPLAGRTGVGPAAAKRRPQGRRHAGHRVRQPPPPPAAQPVNQAPAWPNARA